MNNETEIIFREQLGKLPNEVTDFLSSASWSEDLEEIGSMYNLTEEELYGFKREATLVLVGLVHPDAFGLMLEEEVGVVNVTVLEALVANVEKKIFAPIRPALIEFFEQEASENAEEVPLVPNVPPVPQMPDLAPDNLPTNEDELENLRPESESFLPPLKPKVVPVSRTSAEEGVIIPTHPFEEKMKEVFTVGHQSINNIAVEPSALESSSASTQTPKAPPIPHADPYREPIE